MKWKKNRASFSVLAVFTIICLFVSVGLSAHGKTFESFIFPLYIVWGIFMALMGGAVLALLRHVLADFPRRYGLTEDHFRLIEYGVLALATVAGIVFTVMGFMKGFGGRQFYEVAIESGDLSLVHPASFLYIKFLKVICSVTGNSIMACGIVNMLVYYVSVILCFLSTRRLLGEVQSVAVFVFMMVLKSLRFLATTFSPDVLFLLLFSLVLFIISKVMDKNKGVGVFVLFGVLIGVLTYFDIEGITLAFLVIAFLAKEKFDEEKNKEDKIATKCLTVLLTSIATFAALVFVDGILSGAGFINVMMALENIYHPAVFRPYPTIGFGNTSIDEKVLLFGVIGFTLAYFFREDYETFSPICVPGIVSVLLYASGLTSNMMNGSTIILVFATMMWGVAISYTYDQKTEEELAEYEEQMRYFTRLLDEDSESIITHSVSRSLSDDIVQKVPISKPAFTPASQTEQKAENKEDKDTIVNAASDKKEETTVEKSEEITADKSEKKAKKAGLLAAFGKKDNKKAEEVKEEMNEEPEEEPNVRPEGGFTNAQKQEIADILSAFGSIVTVPEKKEVVEETNEEAKEIAEETSEEVKEIAGETSEEVKETVEEISEEVKETVEETSEEVKETDEETSTEEMKETTEAVKVVSDEMKNETVETLTESVNADVAEETTDEVKEEAPEVEESTNPFANFGTIEPEPVKEESINPFANFGTIEPEPVKEESTNPFASFGAIEPKPVKEEVSNEKADPFGSIDTFGNIDAFGNADPFGNIDAFGNTDTFGNIDTFGQNGEVKQETVELKVETVEEFPERVTDLVTEVAKEEATEAAAEEIEVDPSVLQQDPLGFTLGEIFNFSNDTGKEAEADKPEQEADDNLSDSNAEKDSEENADEVPTVLPGMPLENPLPVPKKHVHKTLDYDIDVSEDDDFDVE